MLLLIVGKTSSGKDTIAKYIKAEYGFEIVVSYTTRDIRKCEVNGREHWFVSEEEMNELEKRDDLLAWTKSKQGIRYCATEGALKGKDIIYIINPNGVEWLKANRPDLEYKALYVDLDDKEILRRATMRGDSLMKLTERLKHEQVEFNNFRDNKKYDYYINTKGSIDETRKLVVELMEKELNYVRCRGSLGNNTEE